MRCAHSSVRLHPSREREWDAQAQTPALVRDLEGRHLRGSPGGMQLVEQLPRAAERTRSCDVERGTILAVIIHDVVTA